MVEQKILDLCKDPISVVQLYRKLEEFDRTTIRDAIHRLLQEGQLVDTLDAKLVRTSR